MALDRNQALRLASALRDLRDSAEQGLTQAELAQALSVEGKVAAATVSFVGVLDQPEDSVRGEAEGLRSFFCTTRSFEGKPHLLPESDLTDNELRRLHQLKSELLELSSPDKHGAPRSFRFDAGPIVVVCPTTPPTEQGPLADEEDPNFTKLRQYGDLDALIEIYGHLRAENPTLDVFHRIERDVMSDDLSSHVVLLGGIGWNRVTRRIQSAISRIPIQQIEVDDLQTGEIFRVRTSDNERLFYPEYQDFDGEQGVDRRCRVPGAAPESLPDRPDADDLQRDPQPRRLRRCALLDRQAAA